jgi:hypothetical protein
MLAPAYRKAEMHSDEQRSTLHVLTRVAKCIDVDGGIFEEILY